MAGLTLALTAMDAKAGLTLVIDAPGVLEPEQHARTGTAFIG
jgi:hypothetical protein